MTPSTETQRIFTQIADLYDKSCGCDGLSTATSFSTMLREAARFAGGGVPQVQCPRCFALNTAETLGKFCSVGDCPMHAPSTAPVCEHDWGQLDAEGRAKCKKCGRDWPAFAETPGPVSEPAQAPSCGGDIIGPTPPDAAQGKPETEQEAFERWAKGRGYDMTTHPIHWLFLNTMTYNARQGWSAPLTYRDFVPRASTPRAREGDAQLDGNRPLPFDREQLGRFVREAWVRWALTQPNPKPSWLLPYDVLSEADKEADRQIGEAVARWTLIGDASSAVNIAGRRVGTEEFSPVLETLDEAQASLESAHGVAMDAACKTADKDDIMARVARGSALVQEAIEALTRLHSTATQADGGTK